MEAKEKKQIMSAWEKSANEDIKTAEGLYKLKRYQGCLFFCHLAVEKILKTLFVKTNDSYPPPIHKLVRLANLSKIELDKETEEQLSEITTFNVQARYDVLKEGLYKKATEEFTTKYLKITKKLLNFFKKNL